MFCLIPFVGAAAGPDPASVLSTLAQDTTTILNKFNKDIALAAQTISQSSFTDAQIRTALAALYTTNPAINRCAYINGKGVITHVEPTSQKTLEATSITDQKQIQQLLKTGKPVLSGIYTVVIWNSSNHIVKKVIISR